MKRQKKTEPQPRRPQYTTLDSDGRNGEGADWESEDLTGEGGPHCSIDEDGPPQQELLFYSSLLAAVGGAEVAVYTTNTLMLVV
ncbi:hypothetical protein ON010_g1584 [Phytophthora cinnamomi]|nr:hypothetical protein ON010_g1584 [Phytophthora cinnamomi]